MPASNIFAIYIKPRSEIIIPIKVITSNLNEGILDNIKILKGVFLCASIVRINTDSTVLITIANTTEKTVKISQ